jgi:hypothetical protein
MYESSHKFLDWTYLLQILFCLCLVFFFFSFVRTQLGQNRVVKTGLSPL